MGWLHFRLQKIRNISYTKRWYVDIMYIFRSLHWPSFSVSMWWPVTGLVRGMIDTTSSNKYQNMPSCAGRKNALTPVWCIHFTTTWITAAICCSLNLKCLALKQPQFRFCVDVHKLHHCLMHPHSRWNWWHIVGHLWNCFFNCLFFCQKKQQQQKKRIVASFATQKTAFISVPLLTRLSALLLSVPSHHLGLPLHGLLQAVNSLLISSGQNRENFLCVYTECKGYH